ncbi:hypothetical protein P775_17275 [Puniceibacterium antarcticum]|uniref:Acyltransferase 3 domain-containing protein n=1 Tax=Puniceibacterium antarcticum TaxID=1206336 RepID=A0A2G8RBJ8_9RHOB|nr:acyltransferase [Puniceibacterium antarcticum]PIL18919.1 hypothetical protein P775_17275 [Puniceibacterium antarcticum]
MVRNATLDYARLLAACGIVVFHTGAPGAALGYAALPFFLILIVVLAAPAAGREGLRSYARGRARRLLLPWLIWSGIYGALKLAELAVTGAPLASEFAPYMLLTGPALHLWFLPFAFAACLLVHPLIRLAAPEPGHRARVGMLSVALVVIGLAALALRQGHAFPAPLAQWLYALPPVCLGLAFALSRGGVGLMPAVLTSFVTLALTFGWTSGLAQVTLAAAALILCLALPSPSSWLSEKSGNVAIGIYLAHPLVVSVLRRVTDIIPESLMMAGLGCLGAAAISVTAAGIAMIIGTMRPQHTRVGNTMA